MRSFLKGDSRHSEDGSEGGEDGWIFTGRWSV